jgi:integrase
MQKGQIKLVGNCWMFRYWEPVLQNGKVVKKRKARKLATFGDAYRSEVSVRPLADLILAPINAQTARPESTESLAAFLEHVYMPAVKTELRPSTVQSYTVMLRLVQPHLGKLALRDTRTSDIERVLRAVADSKQRAKTSLTNARNFLSGAFRYAIRTDRFNRENPVREVKVPKGLKPGNVPAYTLAEIIAMVNAVDEPAKTVLLVAGLSGLRHGEIRGLRWEDFTGDELLVRRAVWRTHVDDTKTSNVAPVPVVPILKTALLAHRKRTAGDGWIFAGATGKPLVLANLLRRDIKPALEKAGLQFKGWHGFRRGVGSNLYALGVADKTIQEILRHANVATTQAFYIKVASASSHAAMRKLSAAFKKSKRKTRQAGITH